MVKENLLNGCSVVEMTTSEFIYLCTDHHLPDECNDSGPILLSNHLAPFCLARRMFAEINVYHLFRRRPGWWQWIATAGSIQGLYHTSQRLDSTQEPCGGKEMSGYPYTQREWGEIFSWDLQHKIVVKKWVLWTFSLFFSNVYDIRIRIWTPGDGDPLNI